MAADQGTENGTIKSDCGKIAMFLNQWRDSGLEGLKRDFHLSEEDLQEVDILLAACGDADFSGDAFVLFRHHQRLFEVNASLHSCAGLRGQWRPEETLVEALKYRLERGQLGRSPGNPFAEELGQLLALLEDQATRAG